ncbi:hypothetical protein [Actinoplanes sp. NPDC051851]|uniref:hypothetical protein n=1 Tax=Actinoplanes sp. NPDC051851 TaxID=3154753 RepID=UPI0034192B94
MKSGKSSRGGRVVAGAQALVLVFYVAGSFGLLLTAVVRSGDLAGIVDPNPALLGDPAEVGPTSSRNPLTWLFGIGRMLAAAGFPVIVMLVVMGVVAALHAGSVGDRRTVRLLLISTGLWGILAAVAFTEYGSRMSAWLLS